MTLTLYNNYLNHHTVHIADELYRILGNGFHFVATLPFDKNEMKGGEDYSSRAYLILANNNGILHEKAMSLARESDVCLFWWRFYYVFGRCCHMFFLDTKQIHLQCL